MRLPGPGGLLIALCLAACGGEDALPAEAPRAAVRAERAPAAASRPPARRAPAGAAPATAEPAPPMASAHRVRFAPPEPPATDVAATASLASADAADRERAVLEFEGDLAELARLSHDDPSRAVRLAAVRRLAGSDGRVERSALRRALDDRDPLVVAEAILALQIQHDTRAVPALERLHAHPDAEVRALAQDALASLRD